MKSFVFFASCLFLLTACKNEPAIPAAAPVNPINGSWKLVAAKKIIKNDTTTTFPVANQEVIKMFTDTHFSNTI